MADVQVRSALGGADATTGAGRPPRSWPASPCLVLAGVAVVVGAALLDVDDAAGVVAGTGDGAGQAAGRTGGQAPSSQGVPLSPNAEVGGPTVESASPSRVGVAVVALNLTVSLVVLVLLVRGWLRQERSALYNTVRRRIQPAWRPRSTDPAGPADPAGSRPSVTRGSVLADQGARSVDGGRRGGPPRTGHVVPGPARRSASSSPTAPRVARSQAPQPQGERRRS